MVQLSNAEKLIGGLGGEEKRWTDTVATLTLAMDKLPGQYLCFACFPSRVPSIRLRDACYVSRWCRVVMDARGISAGRHCFALASFFS